MVGTTVRVGDETHQTAQFESGLDSLLHTDRIASHVVEEVDRLGVGYTAYPEYPITVFEGDGYWVCFEGRLYDRSAAEVRESMLDVGATMLETGGEQVDLGEWLLSVDGEFLVLAWTKDGSRLSVCNDALARLPVYYHHDAESLVLSRELRYVLETVDVEFDRMGVAQCLLFGYSLGDRTIARNVRRLRPATQLTVEIDDDGISADETTHHTFSFDEPRHADRSRERNASELVSRFREACRNRANEYEHDVISLSGGLDSRSVLAAFHAEGLSPVAATMESPSYIPASDVEVAEQLAGDVEVEWDTYHVDHPNGADLDTLVKTKNGQIGLVTSFILDFFRQLEDEYGTDSAYITGDGGDKVLPDLTPARALDPDELVEYILTENSLIDVDRVSAVTGVPESEIRTTIREHVGGYPETSAAGSYVHFLLYERGMNWLFEGEDRNRLFFWSVTPFYSMPFFRYAMNCPPEQKARYKLYRTFLTQLSPGAAERTHPIYGAPVNSSRHAVAALADDLLSRYPALFETVKPIVKSFNDLDTDTTFSPETLDIIQEQVERNEAVQELFDPDGLGEFMETHSEYPPKSVYRVLAMTSVVDDLNSGESLLESEYNTTFA